MNILEIKKLSLGFTNEQSFFPVLSDVSLSLEQKQTLSIVGESGSGKTLTAMSVLQLLPPNAKITNGEIFFCGKNILGYSQKNMQAIRGKKIALIPQDPMCSLNPLYTIENQLTEVINLHKNLYGKEAHQFAADVLDKVRITNVEQRLKSYPHELSGGMKQRVIIAMALATDAKLIIADEPTTALDVTVQAQIMKLLNEIKQNYNTSIILITHDLGLVAENSDKIAVMYSGKIVEYADTKNLFSNPAHPYTIALLNALPDVCRNKLEIIPGQPPSIYDEIRGCKFHPRCKYATGICKNEIPKLVNIDKNSSVACFNLPAKIY